MPPIHGNPGRAVMLLKQLKQYTLSATLRNARFYGSPAVSESVITSNVKKVVSRDERRALVESYVSKYSAANGGKFPTLSGTIKEVGGCFYVVRNIFQELKFKQNAPLPIVAKALSQVPASMPNDASSQTLNDPQSHSSAEADTIETGSNQMWATTDFPHRGSDDITLEGNNLVVTATHDKRESSKNSETEEEENLTHLGSLDSKADHLEGAAVLENVVPTEEAKITKYSDEITLEGDNLLIVATQEKRETETAHNDDIDSKWDSITDLLGSEKNLTLEECSKNSDVEENLTHLVSQELKADHLDGATVSARVVPTEEAKFATYSDESNLEVDNLPIVATQVKREIETAPNLPGSEKSLVLEECPKNSEVEEEENLTHLVSQESKVDHLEDAAVSANVEETKIVSQESKVDHTEDAAVSANVVPSEETKITSQVSEKGAVEVETGERSSAWSNIVSFAKDFANFWRKK